jgi:hypothetical protein
MIATEHRGRPGGTVLAPWGKVLTYGVSPTDYHLQPSHKYLLCLAYLPDGDFYTFFDMWGVRWDISDGIAKPDSSREVKGRKPGASSVSGLPAEKAIEVMRTKIEEAGRKPRS